MRACVEAFRTELSNLVAFLHNAECETALTTLLLQADRLATLTSEEQALVTALAEAGTRKRRYLYVTAIVGIYGIFERYVDEIIESYVGALSSTVSHYDDLPEAIRKNHLPVSLELLKSIGDKTYHGDIGAAAVIANLHLCLTEPASFQLNGPAFVIHRGNINLDKFKGYLEKLGIEGALRSLSLMPSLENFFLQSDPPRNPRSVSDKELRFMLSPIDDLVDRRNAIAHGVVDQIESIELSISRTKFLIAFVHATHELFRYTFLPLEVNTPGVQELGRPIKVFNNKIACFESSVCCLAVGDRIVVKTEDSLVPYREGTILVIEVANIRIPELRLTETTQFGLEIDFSVRENHTFFVLRQLSSGMPAPSLSE